MLARGAIHARMGVPPWFRRPARVSWLVDVCWSTQDTREWEGGRPPWHSWQGENGVQSHDLAGMGGVALKIIVLMPLEDTLCLRLSREGALCLISVPSV